MLWNYQGDARLYGMHLSTKTLLRESSKALNGHGECRAKGHVPQKHSAVNSPPTNMLLPEASSISGNLCLNTKSEMLLTRRTMFGLSANWNEYRSISRSTDGCLRRLPGKLPYEMTRGEKQTFMPIPLS